MNFFSKLFGSKKDQTGTETIAGNLADVNTLQNGNYTDIDVSPELFMDEQAPVTELPTPERETSPLQLFLNRDYYWQGRKEGYEHHDSDTLDISLKKIRSDYRLLTDRLIEEKEAMIRGLKFQLIDNNGISHKLEKQINITLEEVEKSIEKLGKEKELSAIDEGHIMVAIHAFRKGYLAGLELYHEEQLLLINNQILTK